VNPRGNQSAARIGALPKTEREMLEGRRQAERRASGAPVQKGRRHDPSNVQSAPPAELIPFSDKQDAAADGKAQPTKPTTPQQATQQDEPPTAHDNVPQSFVRCSHGESAFAQVPKEERQPAADSRRQAPQHHAPAETMSARPGSRVAPPADADDLPVEHIAAQLEEAERQRLADYWRPGLGGIVKDDTAPPLAPNMPDEGDDGGQAPYALAGDAIAAPRIVEQRAATNPNDPTAPPPKPRALRPRFANFPAELKALPNWLMWRHLPPERPGQKWRKVPFQTNRKSASSTDSSTWNTFEACCAAYNGGEFDGVGFVFDGEVGDDGFCYVGVDLDNCIDEQGRLLEPALSRIAELQTYTETSVSGTGIHCIVRAEPGATVKYNSVEKGHSLELYSGARFFTFTGVPVGETSGAIRAAASQVIALVQEVQPAKARQADHKRAANHPAPVADEGTKNYWFDKLTPDQKDEAVHYMLGAIAEKPKLFELGENGGNNDDWFSLVTALSLTGALHAEDYFVEFASKAKNADPEEALREKFRACAKNADGRITVGTLLHYARQAGVDLSQRALAERGWMGYPAINFRDFTAKGKPCPSLANAVIAINTLGVEIRQDMFHNRTIVKHNGAVAPVQEGFLTDDTVGAIRSLINNPYRLDCGRDNTFDAIKEIARDHAFDPVLDYLAECQGKWDSKERIDRWVTEYLGCEDTPLNRAIGRLMLIASVRRVRDAGCKFDPICVLEGPEGVNKSTVIRILAGDENFSDQSVLNVSDREAQEQLEGVWLHESADLTGLKKAEVEKVKAFASRQVDRARPAYGRVREDRPRRNTQWATTNDDAYLASQTGNRRFWPLSVGHIDIDTLRRDRDQLWAEAATLEAKGASIVLDPALWSAAAEEQEKRRLRDPWEDVIENMPVSVEVREGNSTTTQEVPIIHQSDGKELVSSANVLLHVLKLPTGQQHQEHGKRLARVMKQCGWQTPKSGRVSISGKQCRGYWRDAPPAAAPEGWKEWKQLLKEWKEWLKNDRTAIAVHYEDWSTGGGAADYWRRLVNGEPVSVRRDKSGYWYAFRGSQLLCQAGCPRRFSTAANAQRAVDFVAAGGDGWEWIA
jgi:predicted P-loop ATPase